MFIADLGIKAWQGGKTLINSLTHSKGIVRRVNAHEDTCGLVLNTLKSDTLSITSKVEQATKVVTKSTIPIAPMVFEGSQVSMHSLLHGQNTSIREIYKMVASGQPLTNTTDIKMVTSGLPAILKVDKEFAKIPPIETDCIVYRGRIEHPISEYFNEDFRIIDKAKIGDIIIPDSGYSYTASKIELAEHFGSSRSDRTMMLKIRLPKGAKVSQGDAKGLGIEVVMPRNAEYRLLSKSTNGNHTEVELEYILPKKDNVVEIEELMKRFNIE
ncbi:MAG: hypothetical protein MJ231_02565 [bacterium]|nr:hypothetical protein [bacterium]